MKILKEAKKRYDEIAIPEELSQIVESTIRRQEEKQEVYQSNAVNAESEKDTVNEAGKENRINETEKGKVIHMKRQGRVLKRTLAAAAGIFAVFTLGLNVNTAFAKTMYEIPIIGTLAQVLTIYSYEDETEDLKISVEIPSIETISGEVGDMDAVNKEIYEYCEQYAEEAVERAKEYREAFLATGGTEEEWEKHNIQIRVWYEIKSQTENYLSFIVQGRENWNSAGNSTRYYNIDIKTGGQITLEELLGENYVQIANESILHQIEERKENGEVFWTPEEGGFAGISEQTQFYINEMGNPVIVFDKYEIAPGADGQIEFEIKA